MSDVFIRGRAPRENGETVEVWGWVSNEQYWTNEGVAHLYCDDDVRGTAPVNVFIDSVDIEEVI